MRTPFSDYLEVNTDYYVAPASEFEIISPFADTESMLYDMNPKLDEELSSSEMLAALALNSAFMVSLKWANHLDSIITTLNTITGINAKDNLGKVDYSQLVKAIDKYQEIKKLTPSNKGVLAHGTWAILQGDMGLHDLNNYRSHIDVQKAQRNNTFYEKKGTWNNLTREQITSELASAGVTRFDLPLDSIYFSLAIAKFQSLNGLKTDGILGPDTFAKLILRPTQPSTITPASTSKWRSLLPAAVLCPAEPLMDGREAMAAIASTIRLTRSDDFVYILGWMINLDFELIPGDPSSKMANLLQQADLRGVAIRVMIWGNPSYITRISDASRRINALKNGRMYIDNATTGSAAVGIALSGIRTAINMIPFPLSLAMNTIPQWKTVKAYAQLPNEMSHHEKIIIVKTGESLTGFCGGVDLHPNRINELHDVHCKLGGNAALELLKIFKMRWESQLKYLTSRGILHKGLGDSNLISDNFIPAVLPAKSGDSFVKIFRTYNHWNGLIKDRSIKENLHKVISNAERFIWMEDQYMVSCEIASWLNERLRNVPGFKVTILTQNDKYAKEDMQIPKRKRKEFIAVLKNGIPDPDKVRILQLVKPPAVAFHEQVHSKMYVIDDDMVVIGSANCNRRSMSADSETAAFIYKNPDSDYSLGVDLMNRIGSYHPKAQVVGPTVEDYTANPAVTDLDDEIIDAIGKISPLVSLGIPTNYILLRKLGPPAVRAAINSIWEVIDPNPDNIQCSVPSIKLEGETYDLDAIKDTRYLHESNEFQNEPDYSTGENNYEETEYTFNFPEAEPSEINVSESSGQDVVYADEEELVKETLERESAKATQRCEGHTCWTKTVLNKLSGLNLPLNNKLDETTKNAIADFQVKNSIAPTRVIDFATERALLEADAIHKYGTSAVIVINKAKTKIEDWTKSGLSGVKIKPQHILKNFRDPRKLWAFVLHHMAFKRRGGPNKQFSAPEGYLNTGSHFCIMLDGRIIQLHPVSRMIWHGNCLSPRSVAVEFEGNFPDVKGQWWYPTDKKTGKKIKINEDTPTQAQYESGRFLASYLKIILGTTHILAHRQSSSSRVNDPGPDIWYNVGQWAIDNLGMTDGGPKFKCGTGNPVLPAWRTWGNKTASLISKEFAELEDWMGWEETENESVEFDPAKKELFGEDQFLNEPEEEDVTEQFDSSIEMDDLVKDWSKAVRLNRFYSDQIGWKQFYEQVNDLVLPFSGQENVSLSEEALADAVSKWQQQQGIGADGIIGPKTWQVMKSFIGPTNVDPHQTTLTSGPIAGSFGKLKINTSISALSKSYPEYQFTPEDALWLARFVEGEAGGQDNPDSHAVIWAMFNRFGTVRHRVPSWTSFSVFLRKYSTTLQPLLNSAGAAERVWANNKSNPDKYPVKSIEDTYPGTGIKKVQYLKHIKLQQKKWTNFPVYLQNMITGILNGRIPNPGIGIATHFLSTYVLLKASRRKKGLGGEPSKEEWREYTLQLAKIKKTIWIGERSNLNQQKNAFFIQPEFKDVPADAIKVEPVSSESESFESGLMNEIEYHEAIEDLYKQIESQALEARHESEELHNLESSIINS